MKINKYIIVIILVAIALISFVIYKLNKSKGSKKIVGKGFIPTASDAPCQSAPSVNSIIGTCTKPILYPVPPDIKQKCFNSETLGLSENDLGPSKVTENNGFGKTWYFNYQNGNKFCYVDRQI